MMDFFQAAPNDLSIYYLQRIFGNMNGLFPGGDLSTVMGTMFKVFNSVVLGVGALIVVYITVFGVMASAQEGEFLGKKWHKLWVPLRTVMGIASLVPLPSATGAVSGYSALQVIMMWVILQGVGAADTLWTTVIKYHQNFSIYTKNPYTKGGGMALDGVTTIALGQLFQSVVCDEGLRGGYSNPEGNTGGYYCYKNTSDTFCQSDRAINFSADLNQREYVFGGADSAYCGALTYCDASKTGDCADGDSLKCATCKAQRVALTTIVAKMRDIGKKLTDRDYEYRDYYAQNIEAKKALADVPAEALALVGATASEPTQAPGWLAEFCQEQLFSTGKCDIAALGRFSPSNKDDPGSAPANVSKDIYLPYALNLKDINFIDASGQEYAQQIQTLIYEYNLRKGLNQPLDDQSAQAIDKGWLLAGAYYYFLTQDQQAELEAAMPMLAMDLPQNPQNIGGDRHPRTNYNAAQVLIDATKKSTRTQQGDPTQASAAVMSTGWDVIAGVLKDTIQSGKTANANNPLLAITAAGNKLLLAAVIMFPIYLTLQIIMGVIAGANGMVLGTGGTNFLFAAMPAVSAIMTPLFYALLGLMVTLGATLAVYVPMIPYMVFTLGAIGWMTSCIEAMVAGPLVALGILSPGGHHEVLGKAEPALMLLFNIFLRPSLMIFGLVSALLLASVAVSMVNAGFGMVYEGVIGDGKTNLIQSIFFFVAYVMLILTILNKCFAAIHIIPEKVVRWIGMQGESYGEDAGLGEVKGGVSTAGSRTAGGMQSASGLGDKAEGYAGKLKDEGDAKAKKNTPGTTGRNPPTS